MDQHNQPDTEASDVEQTNDRRSPEERARSIVRNTAIVTFFLGVGRIFGLAREFIMARFVGVTAGADIYRFAIDRILNDLYTKIEKLLQPTYLPVFVGRRTHGGDEPAWRFTSVIGTLQFLFLVCLAAAGIAWADPLIHRFFGDEFLADPMNVSTAVTLFRITMVALVIYSLSNLTELTLQSYEEFTIPALAESLRRVGLVGGLLVGIAVLGHPDPYQSVTALILGALAGCLIRLGIQLPALGRRLRRFRPSLDLSNPDVRQAGRLMSWLVVGVLLALTRNLTEAWLALDFGIGALAALGYARKLIDLPWQLLGLAVSQVMYPFISELGSENKRADLAEALITMCRALAFVFVPLGLLLYAIAEPLITVAFRGGVFKDVGVDLTYSAFAFYIPGLVFFAIEDPMLKWFYALSDTRTPVLLGFFSDVVSFTVMLLGVFVFNAELPALALSLVLSKSLKVLLCLVILRFKLGGLPWDRITGFLGKLVGACAVTTGVLLVAGRALGHLMAGGIAHNALYVVAMTATWLIAFAAMAWVLRIDESTMVVGFVRERVSAKLGKS